MAAVSLTLLRGLLACGAYRRGAYVEASLLGGWYRTRRTA